MRAKDILIKMDACRESISWVHEKTVKEAWTECHRSDWMLFYYAKTYPEKIRELILAKAHCANTVRHLMQRKESIFAVDTAIEFGEYRSSIKDLKIAYDAASDAAYDAASDADYSAYFASYYSSTPAYCSYASGTSTHAACASASAAPDDDMALVNSLLQTADICRKYLVL